jgi:hypothetical protein
MPLGPEVSMTPALKRACSRGGGALRPMREDAPRIEHWSGTTGAAVMGGMRRLS